VIVVNGIFESFVVMGCVNLDWNRYVLAIAILSTVYSGGKAFRQALELWAGKRMFQQRTSALIGFFGDQVGLDSFLFFF
jgi:hypothetical protein